LRVYNVSGQLVKHSQAVATGFVQKAVIDLRESRYAKGMYLVIAEGTNAGTFKIIKR